MNTDPNFEPRQDFIEARNEGTLTREKIEEIDRRTVWEPVEPNWWLEMMAAYRKLTKHQCGLGSNIDKLSRFTRSIRLE